MRENRFARPLTLYAAHDTLYSVLQLVDEDGSVVEQYSYSPYGADPTDPRKGAARITDGDENELSPDDSVAEYLYTGRQFDKAVGLNYHRARRLSHNLGRWTRRDPLGVTAVFGDAYGIHGKLTLSPVRQYQDGGNVYEYVGSKPLTGEDSSGLQMLEPVVTYRKLELHDTRFRTDLRYVYPGVVLDLLSSAAGAEQPHETQKWLVCECICAGCVDVTFTYVNYVNRRFAGVQSRTESDWHEGLVFPIDVPPKNESRRNVRITFLLDARLWPFFYPAIA